MKIFAQNAIFLLAGFELISLFFERNSVRYCLAFAALTVLLVCIFVKNKNKNRIIFLALALGGMVSGTALKYIFFQHGPEQRYFQVKSDFSFFARQIENHESCDSIIQLLKQVPDPYSRSEYKFQTNRQGCHIVSVGPDGILENGENLFLFDSLANSVEAANSSVSLLKRALASNRLIPGDIVLNCQRAYNISSKIKCVLE